MKLIEKLAKEFGHEWANSTPRGFRTDHVEAAYEAGFRKAKELLLNDAKYSRTNWIEIPKKDLERYGESEGD